MGEDARVSRAALEASGRGGGLAAVAALPRWRPAVVADGGNAAKGAYNGGT